LPQLPDKRFQLSLNSPFQSTGVQSGGDRRASALTVSDVERS
jgi:hypothetical protein